MSEMEAVVDILADFEIMSPEMMAERIVRLFEGEPEPERFTVEQQKIVNWIGGQITAVGIKLNDEVEDQDMLSATLDILNIHIGTLQAISRPMVRRPGRVVYNPR